MFLKISEIVSINLSMCTGIHRKELPRLDKTKMEGCIKRGMERKDFIRILLSDEFQIQTYGILFMFDNDSQYVYFANEQDRDTAYHNMMIDIATNNLVIELRPMPIFIQER